MKPACQLTSLFANKHTICTYAPYSRHTLYAKKNNLAREKDTPHKIEAPTFYLGTHLPTKNTNKKETKHDTHTNNMEQPKKHKSRIAKIESVFSYMLSPAQTYKRQSDPKAHGLLSSGDSGSLSRKHMKVIESVYQTVTHTHSHIHKAFYIGSQHRNGMQSRGWSRCT